MYNRVVTNVRIYSGLTSDFFFSQLYCIENQESIFIYYSDGWVYYNYSG